MYLHILLLPLYALLLHAAPTSNTTLLDVHDTAATNSNPAWAAGTCKVKVNLRQECIHDFNGNRYVTTFATFDMTDNNGSPIYNLWGRGIGEEYPANEINLAHIQGPSFQFHWKWDQSASDDVMNFGYDWDDKEHSENDVECDNGKGWSKSSGGYASSWWHGCLKQKVKEGATRTRHTTCPFKCSYKHTG